MKKEIKSGISNFCYLPKKKGRQKKKRKRKVKRRKMEKELERILKT
jgi:hypothetical protein